MFQQVAIVAPGLLGASLAMAARKRRLAQSISVYARRPETIEQLGQAPWCDFASGDLSEACRGADFIALCAPVERIIELAAELAPGLQGNPIVTDVGSVKGELSRRCHASLSGKGRFVGSHPMAGSEKTGMANADPELFQGRVCFVTALPETDAEAEGDTRRFWQAVGAKVLEATPEEHDEIVAQVSHLPHLAASALAAFLGQSCPRSADYCGNGLRDTTRIASGDPLLWREIIAQNRPEILRALRGYQDQLQALTAAIANEDQLGMLRLLADGKAFRDAL